MQESRLQKQLLEDTAQDVPPFAADSIQLAREMGTAASDMLIEEINAQGKSSLLALEALREADADAYRALPSRSRAKIYAEALRTGSFYNTWGVPGYQLSDTAKAVIDLGEEAIAFLKPLLDDKREAPLSGSHSASTSKVYGNRIRDYAWVLISEILNHPIGYSMNPVERDKKIEALRRSLTQHESQ